MLFLFGDTSIWALEFNLCMFKSRLGPAGAPWTGYFMAFEPCFCHWELGDHNSYYLMMLQWASDLIFKSVPYFSWLIGNNKWVFLCSGIETGLCFFVTAGRQFFMVLMLLCIFCRQGIESIDSFYSKLSFERCLYSKQPRRRPWSKGQSLSPSALRKVTPPPGVKIRRASCPL